MLHRAGQSPRLRHVSLQSSRALATGSSRVSPVPTLKDRSMQHFRDAHFGPEKPALFPRGHFGALPAIRKWFKQQDEGPAELNTYLQRHGDITVPLELTKAVADAATGSRRSEFQRFEAPLSLFLEAAARMQSPEWDADRGPWIYLAQCPLFTLPSALQDDLPASDVVTCAGKGDVYDSSIWLGRAPTYTSLHKDPNPNLFVQLAGRKIVRLTDPLTGTRLYHEAKAALGQDAGRASMRGEEMMAGAEKEMLKAWVWGEEGTARLDGFMEATLDAGDGIFIPKGWWHSIVGVRPGMTGSVNWWFR